MTADQAMTRVIGPSRTCQLATTYFLLCTISSMIAYWRVKNGGDSDHQLTCHPMLLPGLDLNEVTRKPIRPNQSQETAGFSIFLSVHGLSLHEDYCSSSTNFLIHLFALYLAVDFLPPPFFFPLCICTPSVRVVVHLHFHFASSFTSV